MHDEAHRDEAGDEAQVTEPVGSGVGVALRAWSVVACAAAGAAASAALLAPPAGAGTATANISAGPLAVTAAPLQVAAGQVGGVQALQVTNATGSGGGWSISAAATSRGGGTGGQLVASCAAGPGCRSARRADALLTGRAVKVLDLAGTGGAGRDTVVLAWSLGTAVAGGGPGTVLTVSLEAGP